MVKNAFRRPGSPGVILTTACSLAWLLGTAPAGAAVDDKLSEGLRSNEAGQQQIQTQAQEFSAQLRAMSAEFERNGLKGDEVKTLDLLSASIGTMSEQDMTRIINLLRQARTVGDQRTVLQQVAAAYAGQKNLTTEMRGLLASFQKDQAAADVAASLAKLAERQATNFQTGVTTARWTEDKKPNDGSDMKAALEVQGSEQAALRDEAKQAAARLQAAARGASDPAAAAKAQEALQKFAALNAQLDQAAKDLQEGHLFKALSSEKAARDSLRQLARELTPLRESPGDALRQSEREMADIIAQQKEMVAQTERVQQSAPDMDQWLKKELDNPNSGVAKLVKEKFAGATPEQLKEEPKIKGAFASQVNAHNQQLAPLESKANELANRSEQVGQDLKQDAAQAAAAVKGAQDKLQDARADLDDKNGASALQNQKAALAQMEQAQKQVQAQIAAQDAAQNADRMTQLQAAKQQVQQLTAQQQAASQQQAAQPQATASNAAQETDLKNKAQALQDRVAQAQSPAAAASLQQAASQMQKAASTLSQPGAQPQAQAASTAATAALQQANAQLDKDIAKTAAAQQQLQQVDQVLASLEKIITGQEKVQAETTSLDTKPAATAKGRKTEGPSAGSTQLASQQAALKANTATLVLALNTPEIKPAADPLNSAQSQMENSRAALSKADAAAALAPQRFALTDLLQAKQLLNAKKAELQQQTDPAAAAAAQAQQAAQLATQIAQAQAQASAAQAQIAQAQAASSSAQAQQASQSQASQSQAGQSQAGQSQASQSQAGQSQAGQSQAGQSSASPTASSPQVQGAQQSLDNAANLAGQAAANTGGPTSDALKQSLADAQQALNQAASAAAQGDQAAAGAQAAKAQQALAQAQGQAQAAQSGLAQADSAGGSTPAGGPPQGGPPSSGSQASSQPASGGPGQSPGGPSPGVPSEGGEAPPSGDGSQRDASKIGQGALQVGSRGATRQGSAFAKLPARDRAALQQSQAEKYPQEYGSMIEQYMQSLSDQPGS